MQKSARFTEEDLHKAGYTVVGKQAVPVEDARPDASWTLDRLLIYAKGEMANSDNAEQQAILQSRKSAVHLFRAGHALALVRERCKAEKHGDCGKFKENHGLAGTTANDAIRLYENAKTEDALIGLGITEAKEKFGIAKPKKTKTGASRQPRPQPSGTRPGTDAATTHDEHSDADQDNEDAETPIGPGDVQNYDGNTPDNPTGPSGEGEQHEAGGPSDEATHALADELQAISQRLSEINQDDFGKTTWTKADIRKARTAIAAMNKYTDSIRRKLNNEDPVA